MPAYTAAHVARPSASRSNNVFGDVIEYCADRLYLASYAHTPNEKTPFPYPSRPPQSPVKRGRTPIIPVKTRPAGPTKAPVYFSIDKELLYNAFHLDFGPLHVGHMYRFAIAMSEILSDEQHKDRPIVFWSYTDPRSRANAACILAVYMILCQDWPPHLALAPIAQMDPPPMPFRDAGYSQADFMLNVQDFVYGVWRAKVEGLISLHDFNLEEYERFERVDQGDFNWLTPHFLAFASPQTDPNEPKTLIPPSDPLYHQIPTSVEVIQKAEHISKPFRNVLTHFATRNIGLVVRLNSELYSASYFTHLGIQHLDMIFDDGTCPSLKLVRKFINLAHDMITRKKRGIAVHCKAGLGRTGCLIGAYLIYRHGFTANEIIAFMRFMRPGMVVGPQQHWLHLNQGTFREWWFEDTLKDQILASAQLQMPLTPTRRNRLASNGQAFTPPNGSTKRSALGEINTNEQNTKSYTEKAVQDENLPQPTPGQPRKTSKAYGYNNSGHSPRRYVENDPFAAPPDTEIITTVSRHTKLESESEEEYQLRMLSRRASRSPRSSASPGQDKRRAVSCTSTTVTTTWQYPGEVAGDSGGMSDIENDEANANGGPVSTFTSPTRPKTPAAAVTAAARTSASGRGEISIAKHRAGSPLRRSGESKAGIRKTSGRVGSFGSSALASKAK